MADPTAGAPPPPPVRLANPPRPVRPGPDPTMMTVGYVVALIPALLMAFLFAAAPGFLQPLFDTRGTIAGIPVGPAVLALFGLLTATGLGAVRFLRSPLAIVVALVCTTAALYLVILGPAMVLIAVNLAT